MDKRVGLMVIVVAVFSMMPTGKQGLSSTHFLPWKQMERAASNVSSANTTRMRQQQVKQNQQSKTSNQAALKP